MIEPLDTEKNPLLGPVEKQLGFTVAALFDTDEKTPAFEYKSSDKQVRSGIALEHLSGMIDHQDAEMFLTETSTPLLAQMRIQSVMPSDAWSGELHKTTDIEFKWNFGIQIEDQTFQFRPPTAAARVKSFSDLLSQTSSAIEKGSNLPDLTIPLLHGGSIHTSQFEGKKILLLDFWATWCHGCPKSLAALSAIEKDYRHKDVEIYATAVKQDAKTVSAFIAENKTQLNIGIDEKGSVAQALGLQQIPQTVIVGKDGRVKSVIIGGGPDTEKQIRQALDQIN
jgi:peroxiredoxin